VAAPGAPEVLVPFVTELVPVVDVLRGRVVIVPPPGLFDPDEALAAAEDPDEAVAGEQGADGSGG
jgi:16S rRNA processing protein RimM